MPHVEQAKLKHCIEIKEEREKEITKIATNNADLLVGTL